MNDQQPKKLRVVFFGTPEFAVSSLESLLFKSECEVVAVVTAPDKPAGRGQHLQASQVKEFALQHNLPILQPEKLKNPDFIDTLRRFEADLHVVVAFRMLPEVVWNMPPLGTINVHASLLPQYRGAAPINWAIIHGDTESGVTTFRLKHEIDTGNILLQKKVPILHEDDAGSLYEKLKNEGAQLLVETVQGLADGTITEIPQPEISNLRHAPKLTKETGKIDWSQSAVSVHNLIRGLSPVPGAYTHLNGKLFKIWKSVVENEEHQLPPGTIDTDNKKYLRFACSSGWLKCLEVQLEGKKRMGIEEFLRGTKVIVES